MTLKAHNKLFNKTIKLNHLAVIMDGNRRWAKKNNLKVNLGHKAGIDNSIKILKSINKDKFIKIKYVTLYVFAVNNWKRSKFEVSSLFNFIEQSYKEFEKISLSENFKVCHFGSTKKLPSSIIKIIDNVQKKTRKNKGMQINLAFNYSGREEIVNAAKKLALKQKNTNRFESYLYTKNIPDPELIIRSGGEYRISDFLLWQSAYSELFFTKILWPDYKFLNLKKTLRNYLKRKRNYGK